MGWNHKMITGLNLTRVPTGTWPTNGTGAVASSTTALPGFKFDEQSYKMIVEQMHFWMSGLQMVLIIALAGTQLCTHKAKAVTFTSSKTFHLATTFEQLVGVSSRLLAKFHPLFAALSWQSSLYVFGIQLPGPRSRQRDRWHAWRAVQEMPLLEGWYYRTFASEKTRQALLHQSHEQYCSCCTLWWQTSQACWSLHHLLLVGID